MTLAAVVLCGGRSSRMGAPKAWLPFGGEPMLLRVLRALERCSPRVVVAAPGQELPPLPEGVVVRRDSLEGRGPLQGLAAGLAGLEGPAYVSSCDVPFLCQEYVERMASLLGDDAIAVPEAGGRRHPLAAAYRAERVLPVVEGLLAEDRLRMAALFERLPTRFVREDELGDAGLASLRNINTPEEHEEALRDAGLSGRRPSRPGRPSPGG
ncbi:MAG: molybdenum cofactor guanylyltransferase [Gemmataceae bacterium]|nr:molybdenum cofactor guanylyltransferase [Gemmataceae bacterium]